MSANDHLVFDSLVIVWFCWVLFLTQNVKKLSLSKNVVCWCSWWHVSLWLYPSIVEASSVCNDILEIHECTDQWSCVVGILLDASAKSLYLGFWIYNCLQRRNSSKPKNQRKICDLVYVMALCNYAWKDIYWI